MGSAIHGDEAAFGSFPQGGEGPGGSSIQVRILPYLELGPLYYSINHGVFILDKSNVTSTDVTNSVFHCPPDPLAGSHNPSYAGCVGSGDYRNLGVLGGEKPLRLANIRGGLAATVAASEYLVGGAGVVDRLRLVYTPDDFTTGPAPASADAFAARGGDLVGEVPELGGDTKYYKSFYWALGVENITLYNHIITHNKPKGDRHT